MRNGDSGNGFLSARRCIHKRTMWLRFAAAAGSIALGLTSAGCADATGEEDGVLRVSGSTTVSPVAADAAKILRTRGMNVTVATLGGSAGGISQLGKGQIDVGMSSKRLSKADRKRFPDVDFVSTQIGRDAVGIVIRQNVYEAGVKSLSKDEIQRIFEGKVANWSELGGPDVPVYVYQKEPGRGTREVLDKFLYEGDASAPPAPTSERYSIVGSNQETRTKLSTTTGSVAPLSVAFAEGQEELAVVAVGGVKATPENIESEKYPLSRPLLLLTDGSPEGKAGRFVEFVLSERGQRLVTKHGYLNLETLGLQ